MADAEVKPSGGDKPADAAAAPAKNKPPIKLLAIVGVVMVVEAVGVIFAVKTLGKKPETAEAKELHAGDHADGEVPVELAFVEDKFQNMSSGKAWMFDASMFLQVKKKHEEFVKEKLKAREAEIKEGVSMIFRRATLNQLKEPGLETINRQILAFANKIVEADAEGHERVDRVLIPKCRGFALD